MYKNLFHNNSVSKLEPEAAIPGKSKIDINKIIPPSIPPTIQRYLFARRDLWEDNIIWEDGLLFSSN